MSSRICPQCGWRAPAGERLCSICGGPIAVSGCPCGTGCVLIGILLIIGLLSLLCSYGSALRP